MNHKNTPRSSGSPKPKKRPLRSKKPKSKKRKYRIRNWHDYKIMCITQPSCKEEVFVSGWTKKPCIRQVGRAKWKRESGYHRRSLVETAIFRLKTLFGNTLRARSEAAQNTETLLRLDAMNRMTALGMPQTYAS